jgi:hypothetical protein
VWDRHAGDQQDHQHDRQEAAVHGCISEGQTKGRAHARSLLDRGRARKCIYGDVTNLLWVAADQDLGDVSILGTVKGAWVARLVGWTGILWDGRVFCRRGCDGGSQPGAVIKASV